MGFDPASLAIAGLALGGVGAVTGAVGAISSGNAQAASAKYNAEVAQQNQTLAQQNATRAIQAGEQQAAQSEQATRAKAGAIKAAEAASGVSVDSGSAADVQESQAETGQLDAMTIRNNAANTAYGYETQATGFQNTANLDTAQAGFDSTAGAIGAGSTFLGGIGSAASNYAKYVNNNSPIPASAISIGGASTDFGAAP